MAQNENLTFLGSLPVDSELVTLLDAAEGPERRFDTATEENKSSVPTFPLLDRYLKTSSWTLFKNIVAKVTDSLNRMEVNGNEA